jgi:hypothetical protein
LTSSTRGHLGTTPSVPKKLTFRTRFGSNLGNINHQ